MTNWRKRVLRPGQLHVARNTSDRYLQSSCRGVEREQDQFVDPPEIPGAQAVAIAASNMFRHDSVIDWRRIQQVMSSRTPEAVESAIAYTRFLRLSGLTSDNYPLFLKMLEIENHWVLDALIGDEDPFLFLSTIQPNRYVISKCFTLLTRWHPGGIYPKTLSIALGVLQNAFSSPKDGYKIYPLTIADVDNLGKHLEKEKGQNFPLNRCILDILDRIGSLQGLGWDESMEEVSRQAIRIRSFFFDSSKKLEDCIPQVLMVRGDYLKDEVTRGRSSPRTSTWPCATTDGNEPKGETMDEVIVNDSWSEDQINGIENRLLQGIIGCRTYEAVEAAITYASFLNTVGLTPENYPVFLRMLEIENHWVIDSLIGDTDPFLLLSPVQPNRYIIGKIFAMMTKWHKGGIYPKNFSVILGVLQSNYSRPATAIASTRCP